MFCNHDCPMRICAVEKGIENCAHCNEYACETIEEFFVTDPQARVKLDAIRAGL